MDAKSLTDQLFDILEDLLIENQTLDAALATAKQFLPPKAQVEIDAFVQQTKSDPDLHAMVQRRVALYREQPLSKSLAELRRKNWKN